MTEATEDSRWGKRPVTITFVCVLALLSLAWSFLVQLIQATKTGFFGDIGFQILGSVFWLLVVYGYWGMRKWAVYLSFIPLIWSSVPGLLILLEAPMTMRIEFLIVSLIPILLTGFGLLYMKRMR